MFLKPGKHLPKAFDNPDYSIFIYFILIKITILSEYQEKSVIFFNQSFTVFGILDLSLL